jgi:hypothetical protein
MLGDFGVGSLTDDAAGKKLGASNRSMKSLAPNADDSTPAGTHLYTAPELFSGQRATVQSDLYSLGIVFYQLVIADLTRPLSPGWERQVADHTLRDDIGKCIDGEATRRFTSVSQLRDRLATLEPRRAEFEVSRLRRLTELRRRRHRQLAITFVGLLIAAIVGTVETVRWWRHRLVALPVHQAPAPPAPFMNADDLQNDEALFNWANQLAGRMDGKTEWFFTEFKAEQPASLPTPKPDGYEIRSFYRVFDLRHWSPVASSQLLKTLPTEPAIYTEKFILQKTRLTGSVHLRSQYRTSGFQMWWKLERPGDVLRRSRRVENMPESNVDSYELDVDLTNLGNDGKPFSVTVHGVVWNGFQDQELSQNPANEWDWAAVRIDGPTDTAALLILLPPSKECRLPVQTYESRIGDREMLRCRVSSTDYVDVPHGVIYQAFVNPEPGFIHAIRWQWTDRAGVSH